MPQKHMLSLDVISVGKLKESWWRDAVAEYARRLAPYARVRLVDVAASPITPSATAVASMKQEGQRLLRALDASAFVVVLDRTGRQFSSEALAQRLDAEAAGGRRIQFVIGGAAGVSDDVRARADLLLSLSEMTFPHEMARVVLLEQLYRAATILAEKTYHY